MVGLQSIECLVFPSLNSRQIPIYSGAFVLGDGFVLAGFFEPAVFIELQTRLLAVDCGSLGGLIIVLVYIFDLVILKLADRFPSNFLKIWFEKHNAHRGDERLRR